MAKVLNKFKEVNHDNHIYNAGDTYPAEGFKADADRVSFLSKKHSRYGVAFLEADEQKKEKSKKKSDK